MMHAGSHIFFEGFSKTGSHGDKVKQFNGRCSRPAVELFDLLTMAAYFRDALKALLEEVHVCAVTAFTAKH